MSKPLLIVGGTVIDPAAKREGRFDILVEDGAIADVKPSIRAREGLEAVDAAGLLVVPGFVDLHVHFREPGREDKETIETGSRAAVRGGFTAVCPMPNTDPVVDHGGAVEWVRHEGGRVGLVDVLPIGALTRGERGEELTDFGELFEAGCIALSDDGRPLANSLLMRRALEYAKLFNRPIIQHAEDPSLSAGGVMHEGLVSTTLGLKGIPSESEAVIVARDLSLAELTGGWVHVAHLSCAKSVELIRQAKRRGVRVTCEVTPHHLALTEEAVAGFNADAKVNPPLRSEQDRQALLAGVADGTIDCIATDHAPHTDWEKDADFDSAPFGTTGLETALGVCVRALVEPKTLSWSRLIETLSTNPARIAGLDGDGLIAGKPANLTLIDPKAPWTVEPSRFASKGKHSPFAGWELPCRVVKVIRRGEVMGSDPKGV
ncbi:MAG: dihydroorotase [Candidatus Omnitrophica bacterium]|nr:dihydroorotase [Candidatus Omnitrophota bacterium]